MSSLSNGSYRYRVTVGDDEMAFSAVSGLDVGAPAPLTISLKQGILRGGSQLFDWLNSASSYDIEKKDIPISLTNETGNELLVTWSLTHAFPIKLTAANFDASSNEVAIEELCLMAETITLQFH